VGQATRFKEIEAENAKLKKLVAEKSLRKACTYGRYGYRMIAALMRKRAPADEIINRYPKNAAAALSGIGVPVSLAFCSTSQKYR
jgi:hypothetical protein